MKRLFLLAPVLFLVNVNSAFAEITNPYTLDEKSQALFADSTEVIATSTSGQVTTYHGLENYVTNYINNYLHITFTYTHADNFFASYPPLIYVTDINPVSTSTIEI